MTSLAMDEPKILALGAAAADLAPWGIGGPAGRPLDPDRWGESQISRGARMASFPGALPFEDPARQTPPVTP